MEENKECFTFLLLGKTGHGKSATGNTMLGGRKFVTSSKGTSKTFTCDDFYREGKDYDIHVVDTPGILDTRMKEHEDIEFAAKNCGEALARCKGSVHAFLVVLKFQTKITADEKKVIESLQAIFGENFFNHVIVVITGGDDFQNTMEEDGDNITFKEWCGQQEGPLADLFNNCNNRVVLFNNRETTMEGKDAQLNQIIDIVKDWEPYTSECFKDANEQREELILKHKAPILREEFQISMCTIISEVNKFSVATSEETKKEIQTKIFDLQKKIKEYDQGRGYFKELETNLKQILENIDNKEELIRLNKELDDIRKAKDKWGKLKTASSIAGGILLFASVVLTCAPVAFPVLAGIGVGAAACRLTPAAVTAIRATYIAVNASTFGAGTVNGVIAFIASLKQKDCKKKVEIKEHEKKILEKKSL